MERKIGEVFEYNGVRLKVVEVETMEENLCCGCFFDNWLRICDISVLGYCLGENRIDKTNVKFIKVEDMKEQETKSLPIPEGWEFAGYENGEIKIRKVEPELPTDFEKALGAVKVSEIRSLLVPSGMHGAVSALCKLLIYRNAWWQKLGWKPDFNDAAIKYTVKVYKNQTENLTANIDNRILVFPAEEVRDKFAETFKDLIEEAKELL